MLSLLQGLKLYVYQVYIGYSKTYGTLNMHAFDSSDVYLCPHIIHIELGESANPGVVWRTLMVCLLYRKVDLLWKVLL